MACGIFPDQGSNLCSLHRQANSQLLGPQGSTTLSLVDRSSCQLALWLGVSAVFLLVDQRLGFGPVGHPWSVILLFVFPFFFFLMLSLLGISMLEPTLHALHSNFRGWSQRLHAWCGCSSTVECHWIELSGPVWEQRQPEWACIPLRTGLSHSALRRLGNAQCFWIRVYLHFPNHNQL